MMSHHVRAAMSSWDVDDEFLRNKKETVPQLLFYTLHTESLVIIGRENNDKNKLAAWSSGQKHCNYDWPGIIPKPTRVILLRPWKRHFTALSTRRS